MSQVPEETYTLAQYRNAFKKRFEFTNVTVLGWDANGTHFQWDDARGERHFGVISDLVEAKIVRTGSVSGTIIANALAVALSVTLSPALTTAQVSQHRAWANARLTTGSSQLAVSCMLFVAQPQLRMGVWRQVPDTALGVAASPLHHEQIDIGVINPHWHDDSTNNMGGHTEGETHGHGLTYTAGASSVVVEWYLARILA